MEYGEYFILLVIDNANYDVYRNDFKSKCIRPNGRKGTWRKAKTRELAEAFYAAEEEAGQIVVMA